MGVAAAGSEQDAYEVGRITALEGRAVGIHLAFAPVADVNNNPANPIINTRSYGEDPFLVGRLVAANIRGLQDNGMLATAKHFPGHGDTETDSHLSLPVISAPWPRLDALELVPFRAAIEAGASFVMSGHLVMPAISSNPRQPATLDAQVLTGILRDSLRFHGVVVTDALDMGGIVNTFGPGEAAVLAFLAGADLLLQPAEAGQAIAALTEAVESGRVTFERLDRSVRRLLMLKLRLGLFARRTVALDSIPEVVGAAGFLETARDIAQRSVTLAEDRGAVVDSLRARPRSIALVTFGEENAGSIGNILLRQLRNAGHRATLFRLWPASGPASLDSARALIRENPYSVFAVSVKVNAWKGKVELPEPVAKLIDETSRRRRAVLVAFGSPYIAMQIPHLPSYLLAWGSNGLSEWAAGRALAGLAPITGRLPVSLPPTFPLGGGEERGTRSLQ
jgi:beta-N-acetylhexosaminidase